MNWWQLSSSKPKRKKKTRLGPSVQCNCGSVVPIAHWDDHLNKGNHQAKVASFKARHRACRNEVRRRRKMLAI